MKIETKKAKVKKELMSVFQYSEAQADKMIEDGFKSASYLSKTSDIVRFLMV